MASNLTKRIIPCLDIKKGRVVKGVNFVGLKDAGDPVELARFYYENGADEIVFLDITATSDNHDTVIDLANEVARVIHIPFTIGGGIRAVDQIRDVLRAGADKVALNSSAVKTPSLITEASDIFGNQAIVVAIDTKSISYKNKVFISGGRIETEWETEQWAEEVENLGAGEILLTSMDADGTKEGFDVEITDKISRLLNIPVIASGGAGVIDHIVEVFARTDVDAALAASIFHYGEVEIKELKKKLKQQGIKVRI